MSAPIGAASREEQMILRGRAISLCAQLFSEEADPAHAAGALDDLLPSLGVTADGALTVLSMDFQKPLLNGDVPPYETSYEPGPGSTGGKTFQMADIAGFYRAFGFEVRGQRPDHIAPELEFMALVMVKEAHASLSGQIEAADVCAAARGKFIHEHLGAWLPLMQERAEAGGHTQIASVVRLARRLSGA